MKSYERIVKFVNDKNNVITTKEFKDAKIGFYYINKLIEDNYIARIGKEVYGKNDSFEDEYSIISNILEDESLIIRWDKYRKEHEYARDIKFEDTISAIEKIYNEVVCSTVLW